MHIIIGFALIGIVCAVIFLLLPTRDKPRTRSGKLPCGRYPLDKAMDDYLAREALKSKSPKS